MRRALVLAVVLLASAHAHALPPIGQAFPTVAIEDTAGRTRSLGGAQRPIVLVIEDDASSKKKQAAHAVVGRYSDNPANRAVFELIAVADLERWSWWPAKQHALKSIKKTSDKEQTQVWIDWKGALRRILGLHKAESAFFVIDGAGVLRFAAQGLLDEAQRQALDAQIAALGAKPAPGR